jgi:hypothetical protein
MSFLTNPIGIEARTALLAGAMRTCEWPLRVDAVEKGLVVIGEL